MPTNIDCEFCGMSYPENPKNKGHPLGYPYRQVLCRNVKINDKIFTKHIICKDCYDRLEEI